MKVNVAMYVRRPAMSVIGAFALCSALSGCGDNRVTAESVFEKCDPGPSSNYELSSDKKSIEFKLYAGTESSETTYECLLKETAAPSSVDYRVKESRPIDGTQNADWDGWEMYWSYEGRGEGCTMHFSEK